VGVDMEKWEGMQSAIHILDETLEAVKTDNPYVHLCEYISGIFSHGTRAILHAYESFANHWLTTASYRRFRNLPLSRPRGMECGENTATWKREAWSSHHSFQPCEVAGILGS
jgi:hypothetical protein